MSETLLDQDRAANLTATGRLFLSRLAIETFWISRAEEFPNIIIESREAQERLRELAGSKIDPEEENELLYKKYMYHDAGGAIKKTGLEVVKFILKEHPPDQIFLENFGDRTYWVNEVNSGEASLMTSDEAAESRIVFADKVGHVEDLRPASFEDYALLISGVAPFVQQI